VRDRHGRRGWSRAGRMQVWAGGLVELLTLCWPSALNDLEPQSHSPVGSVVRILKHDTPPEWSFRSAGRSVAPTSQLVKPSRRTCQTHVTAKSSRTELTNVRISCFRPVATDRARSRVSCWSSGSMMGGGRFGDSDMSRMPSAYAVGSPTSDISGSGGASPKSDISGYGGGVLDTPTGGGGSGCD